jgi:Cyclic nucleotide-binding domain
VNEVIVATLEVGRSFGELALLYNTPRTATVRAVEPCVVYSLDRDTFRNTLANSSFSKVMSLSRVSECVCACMCACVSGVCMFGCGIEQSTLICLI